MDQNKLDSGTMVIGLWVSRCSQKAGMNIYILNDNLPPKLEVTEFGVPLIYLRNCKCAFLLVTKYIFGDL